ncbi:MAG TPA: glycosyltransferase family 4 protein [Planctomycetaceae bacterium]|jgi:glycosyltransferase involved in cell wall biosynthesis|nr:glycosyltransferase family 4 protein [Planctomycetaceae bacterium]
MTMLNTLPDCIQPETGDTQSRRLRVALVSSSSGSRGGGELYLSSLAGGLTALGHEVQSVLSNHPRMDELAALLAQQGSVHRIDYRNTYDRRTRSVGAMLARRDIQRLTRELAGLRADVIHLNKQNLEDGLDLLTATKHAGLPAVATVHVTRTMSRLRSVGGTVRDWLSARVLQSVPCPLIAIAQSGVDDLTALGIDPSRLHLVWNGVGDPLPNDRNALRRAWGCDSDSVVLGCIARIEAQKNPLFVPELLAKLPKHVRVVWIGDGSLRESMRQKAADLGVADRLVLPGWQHDARSLLCGFDLFVLPSIYEGFPLAILEAMAAGLPCVVSDVDGVAEAVVDGETGYVCPPNATEMWLERIGRYATNPSLRERAGTLAASCYRERFSLQAMARNTARVYASVCATT